MSRRRCPPGLQEEHTCVVPTKKSASGGFFRAKIIKIMLKLPTVFFLIAISLLAVTHIIALELFLYWQYPWFDIPMHLLGGTVVALGMFASHDLLPQFPARLLYPIPVLLIVLMVSLGWEVFELYAGIPVEENFAGDTIIDLIMDILGGVIGYTVAYSVSSLDLNEETA